MELKKLIAKDFLTYESLEYNFVSKPLMIQGLNLTDDKQKSNGSGKSSIQAMIEFCYTGDNSRGVRDKELVRFGCNSASLELYTSCNVRKEEIHINWKIKVKGSNVLQISINRNQTGWEEVVFSNVNDGKKWILNWLGISKEDLFNYFIINKTRFKSFFKSSNKEKVELINRFSDASIIDGIEEVDKDDLEDKWDQLNEEILKNEGKLQLLKENLIKESNRDFETELSEKETQLKEEIEEIEEEIESLYISIEEVNKEIATHKAEIKTIGKQILIEQLDTKDISKEITNLEKVFVSLNKELSNAQLLVDNFVKTDFEKLRKGSNFEISVIEKNISATELEVISAEENEKKVLKVLNDIEIKLSGTITCPSCLHKFLLDSETPLEKLQENKNKVNLLSGKVSKLKKTHNSKIQSLKLKLEKPKNNLKEISSKEDVEIQSKNKLLNAVQEINLKINLKNKELNKLKKELQDSNEEITILNSQISKKEISIKELKQTIKEHESDQLNYQKDIKANKNLLSTLKEDDNSKEILELNNQILKLDKINFKKGKEFKIIEDDIYSINQWKNNFKQFKMYIANKSLETIEFHCNRYLKGMGSDLKAKFDGYRELANGTIKDEITAKVIRNEERTFGSFSGGEQGRLLFASILANRHMINNTHPYGGLQFLSIDEVFEGVDALGLQSLVEEAKKLQECIMIITHVSDENVGEDVLRVVKRNGISKIE